MPSGKRETERKGNTPVNTGPSPNSDGRANNLVEEADEPARGSGPLQTDFPKETSQSDNNRIIIKQSKALCHRRWAVVQAPSIFQGPKASPSILASSETTDGPPSSFGASNGGAAELDYDCLFSPAYKDGLDRVRKIVLCY
ncbi:hypothetical protein T02_104 [Trichinella nativa]|uniref:Uncharacterized protein n=1 Tax=Trichinella nativa TaxID=6335 RepID=A0A0V1KYK2_9BILA|nr:hypothetical protein T02_104 [Trichinella nativa]